MAEGKPAWLVPHGRPWVVRRSRDVYDNPWIGLTEHEAVAPSGRLTPVYGVVRFKNLAVAVLPLHADATVTLVGQNRLPAVDYSWELPEGGVPMNEDPLEGAKRELREETGLEAAEWRTILPRMQLSNSTTDERAVSFLALDLRQGEAAPDETEDLALARVPFREALDAAVAGHMPDVMTVATLLRAHHMAVVGELPPELARRMLEG
ncbi:MAG: NUDIX hydrolase [Pseudomonadota bacterium]|nr:NUDIX hydrolase [Pseudomonadota bacterium]